MPARALNQQGVRAYLEGRYGDALRYFEAALRFGGPPSELWNIARCQQRLDDAESAAATLARYLEVASLTADERAEAKRELAEIQGRPSRLTVVSAPHGAQI
jgi:Tfp pilus assembly protein PilF